MTPKRTPALERRSLHEDRPAPERTSTPEHWNMIYGKYERDQLGWYAPILTTSLEWVEQYATKHDHQIIDVGGGSSTLVDELLSKGFTHITVLDIAETALNETKKRLGASGNAAQFICHDVRNSQVDLPQADIWHDRAAFHFLKDGSEIDAYLSLIHDTLKPGGVLILGVFSENAPPKCSGLWVNRYTLAKLIAVFEPRFERLKSKTEIHVTPGNVEQEYIYTAWRKK